MSQSEGLPKKQPITFADVILPLALPKPFTYYVPDEFIPEITLFKRVTVSFGKKKLYSAIVVELHHNKPPYFEAKPILSIIDNIPVIHAMQYDFWKWIASYYMCTIGEVYKAALPSGLKLESETRLYYGLDPDNPKNSENFNLFENLILDLLQKRYSLEIGDLIKALPDRKEILKSIKNLIETGAVMVNETIRERYRPKYELNICLHDIYKNDKSLNQLLDTLSSKAPKQFELVIKYLYLSNHIKDKISYKPVKRNLLLSESGVGASILDALIKKEILIQEKIMVSRIALNSDGSGALLGQLQKLSTIQDDALKSIQDLYKSRDVVLLHGVTSSGKTEVYIHLIQEYISQGKQVLYLLPEIALTTQIITRLTNIFNKKVGVYHSKFNDSERVETYFNVLNSGSDINSYQVILGVRSSVFLPYTNLGLIIVDEEHENTYKQTDPAPRYHARDSAIVLASLNQAKVLLGSATPALETYHNALAGKYGLVTLSERFNNVQLPDIKIIDIAREKKRKTMLSIFSSDLINSIKTALNNNEQIILFQNRRGYSPYYECDACGWIPVCQNCDVSLTYHKAANRMVCHYCGFSSKPVIQCLACGSIHIKTRGIGTEKIEDEIAQIFPTAKIARMDLDSTRSKKSYEKILGDFEQGNVDILIGTQMISKGLDFDRVNTVGIIDIDNQVNFPDFRAHERCFQLVVQVAGRAGRKSKQGEVIIQTRKPELKILQLAKTHDYVMAYKELVEDRRQFNYPPFTRLIRLSVRNKYLEIATEASIKLSDAIKTISGLQVLGPESPIVARIQNWHIKNILIKVSNKRSLSIIKDAIQNCVNEIISRDKFKSVNVILDVDPFS